MHRAALKNLLDSYSPDDANEQAAKQKMLEFLDTHADCFERSCVPGHFTASCWLVNSDYSKVLLTHHKKLDRWLQLGGHCDGDPDVLRTALREATEESGLPHIVPLEEGIFDLDIHLIPAIKDEPAHYHFDVRFLLKADHDDKVTVSHESNSLKWFDTDEKTFPTHEPSILRMLNKWDRYINKRHCC